MTAFAAALGALNLSQTEAAELLAHEGRALKRSMVADMANGRTRVPLGIWQRLADLFQLVEDAADEIIADQGEMDGGAGLTQLAVVVATIPLPHANLRAAAAARAMLVIGPDLLAVTDERGRVAASG